MKKILKWGGIALVVIIIIAALSGSGDKNNTSGSNGSGTNNEAEPTPTPMVIEARTLADAFDANQVAAENEWQDKFVQFTAEISNITDSGLSFTNVATKEFSLTQISCKVKDKDQLLPLTNGQTVTVQGIIGNQMIGVIEVKDCEVIQ
ncbi:MAG TPA: hypothetical protein PLS49_01870 [Candidatus Woesebacteria bacterium]|nr:hypothetical protein [Candidatus Woesebacteria bacterium]